jgi:hypothetical protein
LIALLLFAAIAADAIAGFPSGQVAVAVSSQVPANGAVLLFTPLGDRTFLQVDVLPYSIAFDASQRLWVVESAVTHDVMQVWSGATSRDTILQVGGASPVFDAAGNVYVVARFRTASQRLEIRKFSPQGVLLAIYALGGGGMPMSLDLSADQCTMLIYRIASPRAIGRYDVCTSTRLADIPIDPALFDQGYQPFYQYWSFRILPDASLLVADGSSVLRFSATGELLQKYTLADLPLYYQLVAVALDPSGTRFWVAAQGFGDVELYLLDINAGTVIAGPYAAFNAVQSLAVAGEPRAGLLLPAPAERPRRRAAGH